ncbi:hypothetical protein AAFF_G00167380 [Aldrovandia affinis]|uniref:Uncharacterized protein n=1 Tax=Aldrovandia affinis TaxID=143900 RepID=A0AAD7W8H4_9TELE|nr:hypothetical protein AAFF_G00167380 [Aldrovandia affinis]
MKLSDCLLVKPPSSSSSSSVSHVRMGLGGVDRQPGQTPQSDFAGVCTLPPKRDDADISRAIILEDVARQDVVEFVFGPVGKSGQGSLSDRKWDGYCSRLEKKGDSETSPSVSVRKAASHKGRRVVPFEPLGTVALKKEKKPTQAFLTLRCEGSKAKERVPERLHDGWVARPDPSSAGDGPSIGSASIALATLSERLAFGAPACRIAALTCSSPKI